MHARLAPDRLARTLIYAGIVGFVWFFFVQPSHFGSTLCVNALVGAGTVQYTGPTPFVIPLYVFLLALLVLSQFLLELLSPGGGQPGAALLGAAMGLGLPYLSYRVRGKP
ncbi:hypothetical protein [Meiothermus sp.]|jgi:hypothetical protein|uniref:hypothetical protein n=1 Tax=Meiothermus sp. TaxID=1955249 RepID=UPI0021DC8210|nr:hypothetical protein [Meiothermus sp.]GIW24699.1 MAG: hypothetical protein KatS3mg069_0966 [Meiothermus sp.]